MEIERKFLVRNQDFRKEAIRSLAIRQGYLSQSAQATVRVRLVDDTEAYLTIKGKSNETGLTRAEYEYPIPANDAHALLALCPEQKIHKTRFLVPYAHYTWEVDVFHGDLEGLIIAEVELNDANESPKQPEWIGSEVTGDIRYYNASLATAKHPPQMNIN